MILNLTLKKQWFDMIQSAIKFSNGYSKSSPTIYVECKGIKIGISNSEWCHEKDKNRELFIIELGNILQEIIE